MIELSPVDGDPRLSRLGFAGDTLNTAVYLKRCAGARADVAYVTALGDDPFSDRMIGFMRAEGLSTGPVARLPGKLPGLYAITTDDRGERTFHYWRENSAARQLFRMSGGISFAALDGFDIVYLSAITLAILPPDVRNGLIAKLEELRNSGAIRIAFDSNYRPQLWKSADEAREIVSRMWTISDIALPSMEDEKALFGVAEEGVILQRLAKTCRGIGALKRGPAGPLAINEPQPSVNYETEMRPLDTTAAGDSFNGAFLAAYARGLPLPDAMLAGHECALTVIRRHGAIIDRAHMPANLLR